MAAMRVEVIDSDTQVRRLTYWNSACPDPNDRPTIVATTSSDAAGGYVLSEAVLDRIMAELAIGE
jgi:hypothetical protein